MRNPVPLDAPQDESLARSVADRFDGVSVEGKSVLTPAGGLDHFERCAKGASPLVNMSDFLMVGAGPEEEGSSRCGSCQEILRKRWDVTDVRRALVMVR